MFRTPVSSSNLASIGYDAETLTLEIAFSGGGVYQYDGVPADVYAELMVARSHGKYFYANIKGVYGFRKTG